MASQSLRVWQLCPILGETIKRAAGLPQVRKFDASTSKTKLWSKWNVHANFDAFITKCTNKLPIHYTITHRIPIQQTSSFLIPP